MLIWRLGFRPAGATTEVLVHWDDWEIDPLSDLDLTVGVNNEIAHLLIPADAVRTNNPAIISRTERDDAFERVMRRAVLDPEEAIEGIFREIMDEYHARAVVVRPPAALSLYCPFSMVYRGVEIGIHDNWTDWSDTDLPLFRPDDRLQAMIQIADKQAPLFVPAEHPDSDTLRNPECLDRDSLRALVAGPRSSLGMPDRSTFGTQCIST